MGGINPIDSAGHYFKCAFGDDEEISSKITWLGTKFQRALKGTRFAQACEGSVYFLAVLFLLLFLYH